ncbi:DNA damage-binding protein CMR1 [Euphorbia peplus]|nr:DNA damage-binding protein CMR1 [Euphorbia peplus]
MAPNNLTEYEIKRLQNIRRNEELLAALKVKASELSASSKRHRVKTDKKKPNPEDSPVVIRQSLRSRGVQPDSEGLYRAPVCVMGPVSISDVYGGKKTRSDRALVDTVMSLQEKPQGGIDRCEQNDDIRDSFECGIEIEKKEVESCVDLGLMKLKPENVVKLMTKRITVVRFLPCNDVKMIAAGGQMGSVAFWKPDRASEEGDGVYLYHLHTAPVSGILFHQSCLSKIFTSSYDGFVRMMNAEKEIFDLIHCSDDDIYSMAQRPTDMNSLYFGEGIGGLSIFDERMRRLSSQWMLHENRINSIDFNSQNPNIMVTGSTDGTACLWDLRSVNADKPNCLKTVKESRAVYSAYFSPSGSFLATTSLDGTVDILNCANFEENPLIYHSNKCGGSDPFFRAMWGWDDSYVYTGNVKRGVDVISRLQGRTIFTLETPQRSSVPSRFDIHPYNIGMLAGANSGGQVFMWTST